MRNLLIAIALLMLLLPGCRKDNQLRPPISERKDFFNNESDAIRKVNTFLNKYPGMPKADTLESISYIDSKTKSYAFVFYRSKRGIENIVIEQEYSGTMISHIKSIKCAGEDCDCKVVTVISDEGDVTVDCTCHSCDMIIRQ